jgi:D-apionolactonase
MSTSTSTPDITLRLYGEPRTTTPARYIDVGGLSFALEGMALRWIRRDEVELLRGIAFVVRDRDWGTYTPEIRIQQEETQNDRARLSLSGMIGNAEARLACIMRIEASPTGLTVAVEGTASGDFETNRTGFVILHPASCAGEPVRVEHTSGKTTQGHFPKLISPHQPFMDIRVIEHQPISGMIVTTRFEGDVFEMEDQRNWSDASFKSYSRPLALPFPYIIRKGEAVRQTVQLTLTGTGPARRGTPSDRAVEVRVTDGGGGYLPRLGVGGRPQDYVAGDTARQRLGALRPSLLLVELDAPGAEPDHLDAIPAAHSATGASLALMLRRRHGEVAALAAAGPTPSAVALVGADAALIEEARRVFPGARIGAGTDAFFAEFNRLPPVAADFAFWTVNPTVHADDDASVMETLAVLADQTTSARAHCPGIPLWCGPVTLRMRFNPNATGPAVPVPTGTPPADVDARQRGLFGAAFTLGEITAWATAGIDTLVLYAPFGARGLIHTSARFSVAWYDNQPDGTVYAAYHVLAGLAPYSGALMRSVETSPPGRVTALATQDSLWLANLGPEPVTVATPGKRVRILDAESFLEATIEPDHFWDRGEATVAGVIQLNAYAVARVSGAGGG